MMKDVAIRIENLGKQYFIGQGKQASYETLSERLGGMLKMPLRSIRSVLRGQSSAVATDHIWALKDISLEVQHGEVVGIIGRNGAGKSTLLKILSQITTPTEGSVDIYGRVGALLEVGTGFHPELTGRENVYLNGAILGMKRTEIKQKFDEIVAFSGVEKFIDTPVKYYSSGMQVRLAFAVAAHLEPEILIVDEVLAVGDAEFQKKCLGKMGDVAQSGRTVLFVSHNMATIANLCSVVHWVDNGQIRASGDSKSTIQEYISSGMTQANQASFDQKRRRFRSDDITMTGFQILNAQGEETTVFDTGDEVRLRFSCRTHTDFPSLAFGFYICGIDGIRIAYGSSNPLHALLMSAPKDTELCVECTISNIWLTSGSYYIDAIVSVPPVITLEYVESAGELTVVSCSPAGTGYNLTSKVVPVMFPHTWSQL